jgi:hypothetical protein
MVKGGNKRVAFARRLEERGEEFLSEYRKKSKSLIIHNMIQLLLSLQTRMKS